MPTEEREEDSGSSEESRSSSSSEEEEEEGEGPVRRNVRGRQYNVPDDDDDGDDEDDDDGVGDEQVQPQHQNHQLAENQQDLNEIQGGVDFGNLLDDGHFAVRARDLVVEEGFIDDNNNDNNNVDNNDIIPIPSDFWQGHEAYLSSTFNRKGKECWQCNQCYFVCESGKNATKAKAHLAKIRNEDVKICSFNYADNVADMFKRQWAIVQEGKQFRKRKKDTSTASADSNVQQGADTLQAQGTSRAAKRLRLSDPSTASSTVGSGPARVPGFPPSPMRNRPSLKKGTPGSNATSSTVGSKPGGIQESMDLYVSQKPSDRSHLEMDWAIASLIIQGGRPFNLVEDPLFQDCLKRYRAVRNDYQLPNRKKISKEYLNLMYDGRRKWSIDQLQKEASVFGIALYGDGATIHKTPFVNIMGCGGHISNAVLEIHDCSKQMAEGGKKDAEFISSLVQKQMEEIDPQKEFVDLVIFDGASNMQKAGRVLQQYNPKITTIHGGEHVVSLFFSDVSKTEPGRLFVKLYRKMYKWFGGRHHSCYALFTKISSSFFPRGKPPGLICPADTRMGGYWIAWTRVLRLRHVFARMFVDEVFVDLTADKKPPPDMVELLGMDSFWTWTYKFMRAMYGPLRLLRLCDSKHACMDKLYFFVLQTDEALKKSMADFNIWTSLDHQANDPLQSLFIEKIRNLCGPRGARADEEEEDDWDYDDDDEDECRLKEDVAVEEEDEDEALEVVPPAAPAPPTSNTIHTPLEDSDPEEEAAYDFEPEAFGSIVFDLWKKRRERLAHDYAITAWILCPHKVVQEQVAKKMTTRHKVCVNRLIMKILLPNNLRREERVNKYHQAVGGFWREWQQFHGRTAAYSDENPCWHETNLSIDEEIHKWHQVWTYKKDAWLGKLACRVTSKIVGIGNAERNWGAVKILKSGQRSHLSSAVVSKQATLFGMQAAHKANAHSGKKVNTKWEDEDLDSLGMSRFGFVEGDVNKLIVPPRLVQLFFTEEEREALTRNSPENKALFLSKYGGLQLWEANTRYTVHRRHIEWFHQRGHKRYLMIGVVDDDDADTWPLADDQYEAFEIDTDFHGLIFEYYKFQEGQEWDAKVRLEYDDEQLDETGHWEFWSKKPAARGVVQGRVERPVPGNAVQPAGRASLPGPAGPRHASLPGPAGPRHASLPGPAGQRHASRHSAGLQGTSNKNKKKKKKNKHDNRTTRRATK